MAHRHECHVISFGSQHALKKAEEWCSALPGLNVLGVIEQPIAWKQKIYRLKHVVTGNPPSLARWESSAFSCAVRQALEWHKYDIVHCDSINMAQYWPLFAHMPSLLSTNDAVSMRYWRSAKCTSNILKKTLLVFSAWRISVFENKVMPKFNAVHVVSDVDAGYVDPGFMNIPFSRENQCGRNKRYPVLFTSGSMKDPDVTEPLIRFVHEDFKQIRSIYPNAEFIIIGRDAPRKISWFLSSEPGIRYLPWVDNYIEVLASADIAVFLDRTGAGLKTRVLQALGASKAVVGTHMAFEGIRVEDGVSACFVDTAGEATEKILMLLREPEYCSQLRVSAREVVRKHYADLTIGEQWETLYEAALVGNKHHLRM
jgi:glycosyltransferase involved in cell wall biosynthesis